MLKIATEYKEQLLSLYRNTWMNEKYKYVHKPYFVDLDISQDGWNNEGYASVFKDDDGVEQVVGFIEISHDRAGNSFSISCAVNFTGDPRFGIDLYRLVSRIFKRPDINRVSWSMVVGNPIESSYQTLCEKLGGRIEGVFRQSRRTWDGRLRDMKHWGVLKSECPKKMKYVTEE